ncbi:MAG: hypothetical protein H0W50_06115 [Parachlamydiaceae bacterium]|nr:hypothetical protein [Parachlamydiaceae bacterium]
MDIHIDKQAISNMMIIAQSVPSTALKVLSTFIMEKVPMCPKSIGNTPLEPKAQKALNLAFAALCPPFALGFAVGTLFNKLLEKSETKNNEKFEKKQAEEARNTDLNDFVPTAQNAMANNIAEFKRGMEELKRGNGPNKAPEESSSVKTQENISQHEKGLDYEALFPDSGSTIETPNFQLSDEQELDPELEKGFGDLDDFDSLLNDINASHNEGVKSDDSKKQDSTVKEEKPSDIARFESKRKIATPNQESAQNAAYMVREKASAVIKGNFNPQAISLYDKEDNPKEIKIGGKDYCAWATTQGRVGENFESVIYLQGKEAHESKIPSDKLTIILNLNGEMLVAKRDGKEVDSKELKAILKNLE